MSIKNDPSMDTEISDLYQSTQGDGPSSELDAAILAQAEAAVTPKRRRPAWIAPVGLAATLFLGVNLAVNLKDYSSAPDIYAEAGQSVAVPSNLPESQISSETAATLDDSAQDHISYAREPAAVITSLKRTILEQYEETNTSDGAPASGPAKAKTVIEVDQLLSQVRQGNTARLSEESKQQIERFRAERAADDQKKEVDGLMHRSVRLRQPVLRKRSDNANSAIANSPLPVSPKRDITVSVSATPPTESGSRFQPSKPFIPAAPQISASALPKTAVPAAAPAPNAREISGSESEDAGIQEVVVTDTKIPQSKSNPHARLTAREQTKRNEYQQGLVPDTINSSAAMAGLASETNSDAPDTYLCDLEALGIDVDTMESAKVDARNLEPPLNAVTWPGYIRNLAEENNYVDACTHLAVYQQLYPGIAMIELLPLTIVKQK